MGQQPVLLCLVPRHPELPDAGNAALLALPAVWQMRTGSAPLQQAACMPTAPTSPLGFSTSAMYRQHFESRA